MKKNEHGYMMLITVLAIVLISVLGLSIITVSSNSLKTSTSERSSQSNFYYSEAGLNFVEANVLDEIEQLYEQQKKAINISSTNADITFNSNFDNGLKLILNNNNNKTLTKVDFYSTANGEPTVNVKIIYNPLTPREFKIQSVSNLSSHSTEKKVERSYKIPNDLITKVAYEEIVTPPTYTQPSNSTKNYTNEAQFYISDYLSIQRTGDKLNAKFNTDFKERNIFKYALLWGHGPELKKALINFDKSRTTPNISVPYKEASYTDVSKISNKLSLTSNEQKITGNYLMPSLPNFTKQTFNLTLSSANTPYTVAFTGYPATGFFKFNNASVKFNVKGPGTLNIVMDVPFHLALGERFIIKAENNAVVNLIFRNNVQFNGELLAQDIYVENNINFEPSYSSKIIAENVYIKKGKFDKDFNASVQIKNLYIEKGNLSVTGNDFLKYYAKPMNADNIYLKSGDAHIYSWGNLITDTITADSGNIHVSAYSCLQADTIITKPSIALNNIGGYINTNAYYSTKVIVIAGGQINNTPCSKETVVIPNELPGTVTTVPKFRFDFNHTSIINKDNLIEIK